MRVPRLPQLLARADQADSGAADELFAMLYGELRRLAERHLQRRGGSLTLGTTTLVHDACLSMMGWEHSTFPLCGDGVLLQLGGGTDENRRRLRPPLGFH